MKLFVIAALTSVVATACFGPKPVSHATDGDLSPDRATECYQNCEQIGMHLSSVVLIMNSAGCVCVPNGAPPAATPAAGASASAGGAEIAAAQAAAAAQATAAAARQLQIQRQQQQSHPH